MSLELLEMLVPVVLGVMLVHVDILENEESMVKLGDQVQMAPKERGVKQDRQGPQDSQVLLVLLDPLD